MSLSVTLITILSGVTLLLWGLRMVKRAVLRGYGDTVQTGIAIGTKNRFLAALSGMIVTMGLQSSTATALLASSFVGRGLMTASAGLAVMIGADLGTALVTQVLSLKVTWLAPLLLSTGIIMHLCIDQSNDKKRHLFRIIIGLGFMLMALGIIREAAEPIATSENLPLILAPLLNEPLLAVFISAAIAYLMHSSVSTILLFATFATAGVLPLELALMFVIGANVGVGFIPLFAVMKDIPEAMQVPLGNLIMRIVMGVITLFFIHDISTYWYATDQTPMQKVIFTHIGFNLAILLCFLPFIGTLTRLCQYLSPSTNEHDRRNKPRYLDAKALNTPSVALSCATRETLSMAEILELMLKNSYKALATNDEKIIEEVQREDDNLDRIFASIKHYIIRLSREELKDDETERSIAIMTFAINLEHCGDIIEKSLMPIAAKKTRGRDKFSPEGLKEIKSFHNKVVKNLQLAQSIFLSNDPKLARQLIDYKKGLKLAESATAKSHMKRLRSGLPETVATSDIHMDVIRDLRRINSYVSSVAYEILDENSQNQSK
jgi:phosphate:Na+ symporter